jgi:predicted RNA polymerase sigma factor
LLSVLVVRTRRLDLAEDALAESFSRATSCWPRDGVPDNPSAWLYVTARRVMLGRLRSEAVAGRVAPLLAVRGPTCSHLSDENDDDALPDDRPLRNDFFGGHGSSSESIDTQRTNQFVLEIIDARTGRRPVPRGRQRRRPRAIAGSW